MARSFDHVAARSARNRVIDAIRIGDCYPLTDLNIVADRLKVPFGGTVKIPIVHAQSSVHYELCDPKGQPLGAAFAGDGQDATLVVETPAVQEDVTYRIRATKPARAGGPPLIRFLEEPAPVKVGLDTSLVIEVGDVWRPGAATAAAAALLDVTASTSRPGDPRLVPYASAIDVKIDRSQEGVEYSLIIDGNDVPDVMRMGDLGTILLRTPALHEDCVIQVRATKRFLAADSRSPETSPLDRRLLVKIEPNPSIAVAVAGGPIVDFAAIPALTIADSQPGAIYRFYLRSIPDSAFIHGPAAGVAVTTVDVPGEPSVQVCAPDGSGGWVVPDDYRSVGESDIQGTGGDVTVPLGPLLLDDSMVIVQAAKMHRVSEDAGDDRVVRSAIRLDAAVVILVRPDPRRPLAFRVPTDGSRIVGDVRVTEGQPGVMYQLSDKATGTAVARPAYFHKRDAADATQNKGIGQLAVEVDLVVPAPVGATVAAATELDRSRQIARPPELTLTADAVDVTWRVSGRKAQTGVGIDLEREAVVGAPPAIRPESPVVDSGTATGIIIENGRIGERYQLFANRAVIAGPVDGSGDALSLSTGPLTADTAFELAISRSDDTTAAVLRVVSLSVTVRPAAP